MWNSTSYTTYNIFKFIKLSIHRAIGRDYDHALSQPMVSRYIDHYTQIIVTNLAPRYIIFPQTADDFNQISQGFEQIRGFPNVIGVLDCTHVELSGVSGAVEIATLNRRFTHSINAQIICDSRLFVTNVNAKWGGRSHDVAIYDSSNVKQFLALRHAANQNSRFWLLGDIL